MKSGLYMLVIALACVMCTPALRAQDASSSDPYKALAEYQFGQSREPLANIEAQIRKCDPSQYKAIEEKLLAVLKSADATKDGKRYICRWMAVVGSAQSVPAIAALLADEELSHTARMALEPMADPAAGEALRAALPKVKGKLLAGVISSIGTRRDAKAIDALSNLTGDSDQTVAATAILALGQIGTPQAAKALNSATVAEPLARTLSRAKIACAAQLAKAGNAAEAAAIYKAMYDARQSQSVRIAALKGLIGTLDRADAVKLIIDTVQGDDAAMKTASIAAYVSSTDTALKNAVAEQLPTLKPAVQIILMGVLADQADVAARAAVLKVLGASQDEPVRIAALECLVRHGEAADVPAIVKLAAKQGPAGAAARKTLEQMSKAGVDEAIAALIESPDAASRKVVLGVLANRRSAAAMPILVRLLGGSDAALAAEAAKGLEILGTPQQLSALGAVVVNADDAGLRKAAEAAIRSICTRAADKQACAKSVLSALDKARKPESRSALVRLLTYARGDESLAAVRKATRDGNAEVRETAIRTLIDWPELSAAPYLIEMAKKSDDAKYAVLAIRGCLRLAGLKDQPVSERLRIYASVLDVATRAEEKKQAIAGLAGLPTPGALDLLAKCVKDAELNADATVATMRLAQELKAVYNKRAVEALQQLKEQATNDDLRRQIEEAIESAKNAGQSADGSIIAWMLAGPYVEEGADLAALLDAAFAPEKSGKVEWRPTPASARGLVEMNKLLGGDNRVAYLRTEIVSGKAQDALLEIGSDDGVKVFLNGKVVHAKDVTRPCTPGSDKVKVQLKEGVNTLMLKVTQGGGEWAACCRVRSPEGKPLSGIVIAPNEK